MKDCSIYSRHWRSERCHRGCITLHLLMAEKQHNLHPSPTSVDRKKVRKGRCGWEPHMRGGCAPLTCCAQGSHTKINTFKLMSQPFHVVSEGFSAWGERFWFLTTLFSWSVAAKTSRGNGQAQAVQSVTFFNEINLKGWHYHVSATFSCTFCFSSMLHNITPNAGKL